MNQKPRIFNAEQPAETRAEIHAEVRDWFPTAESLAQQLGTDARRLAKRYPAPNTAALLAQMLREQATPSISADQAATPALTIVADEEESTASIAAALERPRGFAWPLPQMAAAALLLVVGWSLLRWSADKPLGPAANLNNNLAEQPRENTVLPVAIPVAPIAPQEFQTLSAPEREAVLDLLEEQALGTVSLSI